MRILIVSDNHGDEMVLREVLLKERNIDVFLHAGDSMMSPGELYPFVSVKGNNDYLINDTFRIIDIPMGKIYLTHGHLERTYQQLLAKAKHLGCNVIVHGHTHRSSMKSIDDILVICPGSLRFPREDSIRYAVMEVEEETGKIAVKFHDL